MGVTAFKITGDTSVCSTASPVEQKQSTSKPWITLWIESAGDQWIPFTKDQHCGKRFHALMQTWHQQFGYLMLLQEPMEVVLSIPWWRHQMEAFSALLALCEGNHPLVTGGFPLQRPVMRSFDVFFDLRMNKWLSKQSRRRWFETPRRSL